MTAATATSKQTKPTEHSVLRWIKLAAGWHVLLALLWLAGIGWLWLGDASETAVAIKIATTIILAIGIAGSGLAAIDLTQMRHRGRMLSLAINYLALLFCFFGVINRTGGFIGMNGVADNFGRSLPFLFLAFIGPIDKQSRCKC